MQRYKKFWFTNSINHKLTKKTIINKRRAAIITANKNSMDSPGIITKLFLIKERKRKSQKNSFFCTTALSIYNCSLLFRNFILLLKTLYNTFEFFSITQSTCDCLFLRYFYNAIIFCSKIDLLFSWVQFPSTFISKT